MVLYRSLGLVGLLLVVSVTPALAEQKSDDSSPEERLWASYQEIRKVKDVETNRQRTQIARQLGELGSDEALARLVSIFEKDPDVCPRLAAMEALCARGDAKLVARVIRKAKSDKSCLKLWIGALLGKAQDDSVGPWVLTKSRLLGSTKTQMCAVEALGALKLPEAREPLLKLYAKYEKKKNQAALIYETLRALGAIGGEGVRELLLSAAHDVHVWKRLAAAETLLSLEDADDSCRDAVRELLTDDDGLVREAAVAALGSLKDEAYVMDFIDRLGDERMRVRPKARAALVAIAELDLGQDDRAWWTWWQRRQDGQEEAADSISVTEAKDDRIYSNGVMFLLDTSKSMSWQAPGSTNRIDVARDQLAALIGKLDETTPFNVIAVTGRFYPWHKAKGRDGGMVPATSDNKAAAIEWARGLECRVHTNTWDALEAAILEYPTVDTIYYISDGALRLGGYVSIEEIPMRLREINRLRKVVIHTHFLHWGSLMSWALKYEDREEQKTWLEELAQQTGGSFEAQWQP